MLTVFARTDYTDDKVIVLYMEIITAFTKIYTRKSQMTNNPIQEYMHVSCNFMALVSLTVRFLSII